MNTSKQNRLKITILDRPIKELELFYSLDFIFEKNEASGTIEVYLPVGWALKASHTEDKVYLADKQGRKRGYYTTKTDASKYPICLLPRYTIETEVISQKENGIVKEARFVINDNASDTICYIGKTIDLQLNPGIIKEEIDKVESYLKTNYPNSDKILEYWGWKSWKIFKKVCKNSWFLYTFFV